MFGPPPSSLHFNYHLIWQWALVILFFILAAYTAKVIAREKTTFEDDSRLIKFGIFFLPIARWWSEKIPSTPQKMVFHRADTFYEWEAIFQLHPNSSMTLTNFLSEHLEQKKIQMDEDVTITEEASYLFTDAAVLKHVSEFLRIEGTATVNQVDRAYYDLILLKTPDHSIYEFRSESSVLNGSVEGPYFEESLKRIKHSSSVKTS